MNLEFVNLSTYPIDQPESIKYKTMLAEQKKKLNATGMINLVNFLTLDGIQQYKQEIEDRLDSAFHAFSKRQPYGYDRSDQYPDDHPCNIFGQTESYRLARHHMPGTAIDELYLWPPMRRFIADITGNETIYLSGDPSNALVIQVYKEGCGQAWHFDQALFSTIINLGEADAGGVFECVPNIRTDEDANYNEVKLALTGQSQHIQKHHVKAGSFSIMLGRYTLHRVTPIEKDKPRISVVLSYELHPDIHMDVARRKISFGPSAPDLPA